MALGQHAWCACQPPNHGDLAAWRPWGLLPVGGVGPSGGGGCGVSSPVAHTAREKNKDIHTCPVHLTRCFYTKGLAKLPHLIRLAASGRARATPPNSLDRKKIQNSVDVLTKKLKKS